MSDTAVAAKPANNPQPPLFKRIEAIDPAKHGSLKINRESRNYKFAMGSCLFPLTIPELSFAGVHYPIVFTAAPQPMPLAILGYKDGENLFVDPDGNWAPGHYVPGYVRCYPFGIFGGREPGSLVACLDAEGPGLSTDVGDLIIDKDMPTPILQKILTFCNGYHQGVDKTVELGKALHDAGVLVQQDATIQLGEGREPARIGGFHIVDAKKFDELPDNTIIDWRKRGLLGAVYQHLQSLNCLQNLSAFAIARLDMAEE